MEATSKKHRIETGKDRLKGGVRVERHAGI